MTADDDRDRRRHRARPGRRSVDFDERSDPRLRRHPRPGPDPALDGRRRRRRHRHRVRVDVRRARHQGHRRRAARPDARVLRRRDRRGAAVPPARPRRDVPLRREGRPRSSGTTAARSPTLASGKRIAADAVMYSAGRQGATDELDLDAAGLAADDRGRIKVDEHYRTTVAAHLRRRRRDRLPGAGGDLDGAGPARGATHAFGEPAARRCATCSRSGSTRSPRSATSGRPRTS